MYLHVSFRHSFLHVFLIDLKLPEADIHSYKDYMIRPPAM